MGGWGILCPPKSKHSLHPGGLAMALLHKAEGAFGSHELRVPRRDAPRSPSGMLMVWCW